MRNQIILLSFVFYSSFSFSQISDKQLSDANNNQSVLIETEESNSIKYRMNLNIADKPVIVHSIKIYNEFSMSINDSIYLNRKKISFKNGEEK
jgi:hypothetical protein